MRGVPSQRQVYERAYEDPAYRMGRDRLERVHAFLRAVLEGSPVPPRTLLDIGSGRGEAVAYARAQGTRAWGLDLARRPGPDVQADMLRLPLCSRAVDLVLCLDVLEHLPGEAIVPAVAELLRVANVGVLLMVAHFPSTMHRDQGAVYHLTVEPVRWWHAVLLGVCGSSNVHLADRTYSGGRDWTSTWWVRGSTERKGAPVS